ncbi:protocadherin alpha-C2-like isoform X5 [Scyliorhinus canicula]|uniref:protocadherin alpha-C2-like isoform X5 n=1 Tax=Scyliorhinus canicula TaxID=7830 RepID=UPI0018F60681|nr:protocadherin alpha-C2-like isoform X5 [Scyliorhinus canicula]
MKRLTSIAGEMTTGKRSWTQTRQVLCFIALSYFTDLISGQIRYTIPEELKHGAFVANVADDLGLNVSELSARRLRIVSGASTQYLEVNLGNGILFVNEKIDREQLCGPVFTCFLHLEVVIENPLELYRIEVEIVDINDNAPTFLRKEFSLDIIESALPGMRFPLESAHDPDVGTNSVHTYRLSPNDHFILDVERRSDGSKFAALVLENILDREQQRAHQLVLTAVDGGIPQRSGTALITVTVLDANDNLPVFEQTNYQVSLKENAPKGTLVLKLNASDLDEGSNSDILYSFSSHTPPRVHELFSVDTHTGEIRVKSMIDHEELNMFEIYVQAKDKGGPYAIPVHCKVLVDIIDVNDNAPEVILTSLSSPVMEDAMIGTVIALISVTDKDSEKNGHINCEISQGVPFKLQSSFKNHYTLVTTRLLDRERVCEYNITITAIDSGYPSLSTTKSIFLKVSDVNDNAPTFSKPSYTVYITENNAPGATVCSVTALDPDSNQNAYLSYSIMDGLIRGLPSRSYVSINSDNGKVYALRSFDYEQLKEFQIQIQAQDAGFPPLSGTTKVNVIILDQNDNVPLIVFPRPNNGSAALQKVPQSVDSGQVVIKVIATDADSGQNAKLSYQLLKATDRTLFKVALYTGEVRTTRPFGDRDVPKQTLVILVKDSGQTSLSATVTIIFSIMDNITETLPEISDVSENPGQNSALLFYIIITLGSISFLFIVAIIIVVTIKCRQYRNNAQDCNTAIGNCCIQHLNSADILKTSKTNLQVTTSPKVPPDFLEMGGSGPVSQTYYYKVCLTPESAKSDFTFLKPFSQSKPKDRTSTADPGAVDWNGDPPITLNSELSTSSVNAQVIQFREWDENISSQVKQPNADWHFAQTHRAELNSAQYLEEEGVQREIQREVQREVQCDVQREVPRDVQCDVPHNIQREVQRDVQCDMQRVVEKDPGGPRKPMCARPVAIPELHTSGARISNSSVEFSAPLIGSLHGPMAANQTRDHRGISSPGSRRPELDPQARGEIPCSPTGQRLSTQRLHSRDHDHALREVNY